MTEPQPTVSEGAHSRSFESRHLTPADFSFFGFDDLAEPLAAILAELTVREGAPEATTVEDAIYVPAVKVPAMNRAPGRFVYEGGLVRANGEPIPAAQSQRRATRWGTRTLGGAVDQTIRPRQVIEEPVIYLGWYFQQYGHFLAESLARTWILAATDPETKVVFHTMRQSRPEGPMRDVLTAFGIPPERILIFDEPTRLRRVIVPEQLYELASSTHVGMRQPFQRAAEQLTSGTTPSSQPVYLSRRLLPSHLRQIVGEFELEEIMRENGFLIAYPEAMSFEEQVRLINRHDHIFTSAGSAAYNLLFSLHQPTVHFLTSGIPRQDYFLLPTAARVDAIYANCFTKGGRSSINTTPYLTNYSAFAAYLHSQGLLRRRMRSTLAACQSDVQIRFDEVWFYAMIRDARPGHHLAPEVEQEAATFARQSWPVSWLLAHYCSHRDTSRVDGLTRQFLALAEKEEDVLRFAHHQEDVANMAPHIVRYCTGETATELTALLTEKFAIAELDRRVRKERRTASL